MLCKNLLQKSYRRRAARYDDTTVGSMIATQRLGMALFTNMYIYYDSNHSSCQHRKRKELTQHTVVRPGCRRRQVAVTIMVHAVRTFSISRLWDFMNMKRRQYQHRQEYCQ